MKSQPPAKALMLGMLAVLGFGTVIALSWETAVFILLPAIVLNLWLVRTGLVGKAGAGLASRLVWSCITISVALVLFLIWKVQQAHMPLQVALQLGAFTLVDLACATAAGMSVVCPEHRGSVCAADGTGEGLEQEV